MPTLTENLAACYALAIHRVLAEQFPDLATSYLGMYARREISRHAASPDHRFEVIVTYTREWRLHPIGAGLEPWRVELVCHKSMVTDADIRFSESVNARLRAIKLER